MNKKFNNHTELVENSSLSKFESASVDNVTTKSKLAGVVSTEKTINAAHSNDNTTSTAESAACANRGRMKENTAAPVAATAAGSNGGRSKKTSISSSKGTSTISATTAAALKSSQMSALLPSSFMTSTVQTNMLTTINCMLPPLRKGEYDAILPIISNKGYMIDVDLIRNNNSLRFRGYKKFPDGSSGPAESMKLIRGIGDQIIAVDGILTEYRSIDEIAFMIQESAKTNKHKFAIFRFCESKYITKTSSSTTTTTTEH
jgi:hypothetical protein